MKSFLPAKARKIWSGLFCRLCSNSLAFFCIKKIELFAKLCGARTDNRRMHIRRNIGTRTQSISRLLATPKRRLTARFFSGHQQTLVALLQERTEAFFNNFLSGKVYEAAGVAKDTLELVDRDFHGDAAFYLPAHSQWVDILLTLGQVQQAKCSVEKVHARYAGRLPEGGPLQAILFCDEAKIHFFSGEFLEAARKAKIAAEIFCNRQDGFRDLAPRALSRLSESQLIHLAATPFYVQAPR